MTERFTGRLADVIRRPLITEKATRALEQNQYTFEVDPRAAKPDIKAAIEQLFDVKVTGISTMNPPRRARQGSIRTPLRPGGGIVFGPKPRSYNLAMNRKERRLALRTALMARVEDMVVVKDFGTSLEAPKTREITDALGRLGVAADAKVLIILSNASEVVRRSVRNLEKVKLISADQLNVFDLLNANSLVVGETALATIQEVYGDD